MAFKETRHRLFAVTMILVLGGVVHAPWASADGCPELVGRWPYGPVYAVAVSGDYAYFGSGTVLQVVDVSSPAAPQAVGEVVLPGVVQSVAVSEGYAYVADEYASLRVIDVSTPSSPVEVGFYDTPGYAYGVAVSGGYAYVADYYAGMEVFRGCGIVIFDDGFESGDTTAWSSAVP